MPNPIAMNVDEIKRLFQLQPHVTEGGFFAETYRSRETVVTAGGSRSLGTAIYYLLSPGSFSALHKLPGDEIFHFYLGDPVEMLQLFPDGSSDIVVLGQDVFAGMKVQHVVGGGVWQGSRLVNGGRYALLGTTMAPGFALEDYVAGVREELTAQYPARTEMILALLA